MPAKPPEPKCAAATLEELQQQLRTALDAIETGDQWRNWLNFARRLHRYSFNNLILIWQQRPDATTIAGYNTWKVAGRQVRRGERAIRVLAPVIRNEPVLDEHGKPQQGADGKLVKRQKIVGFRPAPVFDIVQTDGPPIDDPRTPVLLAGQAPAGLWDALVGEVSERGYRLLRGSLTDLDGANGRTAFSAREVWVRDDVDDAQAVKTLVHELGHVILHAEQRAEPGWCRGVAEIEAESVAHLVLAAHGILTGDYSFPYVAAWAHPLAAVEHVPMSDIVARTGDRVMKASNELLAVTTPVVDKASEPAVGALADRVTLASARTSDLRDQATAAVLPNVPRATLLGVVADSHDYFRRQLPASWVPGYLAGRGLAEAAVPHRLGYAPGGWTRLVEYLRSLGYTDDHIEAAGVASRNRRGELIDRFRDRMVIPLHDPNSDLVGFTGRISPAAGENGGPKYVNTPATSIFHKSKILYGLPEQALKINNGYVPVVCEGPLDAIAISRLAGEANLNIVGVAAIGTAFTEAHADQLGRAVGEAPIALAFDGDGAGQRATVAVWRRLTDSGPRPVTAVALPADTDPASLYAEDRGLLANLLRNAAPAAQVIAEQQIEAAHLDGNVARELSAFRALVPLAQRMPIEQRTEFVLQLAERVHLNPSDAAELAVEASPNLLMDQITGRCHQLGRDLAAEVSTPNSPTLDVSYAQVVENAAAPIGR